MLTHRARLVADATVKCREVVLELFQRIAQRRCRQSKLRGPAAIRAQRTRNVDHDGRHKVDASRSSHPVQAIRSKPCRGQRSRNPFVRGP